MNCLISVTVVTFDIRKDYSRKTVIQMESCVKNNIVWAYTTHLNNILTQICDLDWLELFKVIMQSADMHYMLLFPQMQKRLSFIRTLLTTSK